MGLRACLLVLQAMARFLLFPPVRGSPMRPKILAVIPAKGSSRRLEGKNMRLLGGKPLLRHAIDQARGSDLVDDLYVSTDSEEIRDYCRSAGTLVPFLRPAEQARDEVHASVPVLDMLERLGGTNAYSHCVMLLPTAPLRTSADIDAVIRLSVERQTNVVSVCPLGKSLFHLRSLDRGGHLVPITAEVRLNFQTQDVPPLYVLNGSIYCAPSDQLLEERTFHYGRPLAHVMRPEESVDVDTQHDLHMAQFLLQSDEGTVRG